MRIPTQQTINHVGGGSPLIMLNPDYQFTQVTITGRNTGEITPFARPLLDVNAPGEFVDDDFETVTDSAINLADTARKRTFTISNKRLTAIKMVDSGAGTVRFIVNQWGRI